MPRPTAYSAGTAMKSLSQPGSRLHYISGAGNDATGELYFWDGSRIVDSRGSPTDASGRAYGADPMNPSSAVKPFKRWAYVAPRENGAEIGTAGGYPGGSKPTTRAGYPDWWLFKRGESFDLGEDLLSFARQSNPSATSVSGTLAVPGGKSESERQIVGAYGDVCQPRPRFTHPFEGFVFRQHRDGKPIFKDVAYLSLHFDGHDRRAGRKYTGVFSLYHPSQAVNILFEDMWFDGTPNSIQDASSTTFRRTLISDVFTDDGKHVQGIFYGAKRAGRLRIEDSILLRNGFSSGDPKKAWPPTGAQKFDIFNRNLYIAGELQNMQSWMTNSVSMIGASGDQFRPGIRLEKNFFYQGYVQMGGGGGYADSEPATGAITDNVIQRFTGSGTQDNRGQPGWGLQLSSGAAKVQVMRNIVTSVQHAGNGQAFELSPLNWYCYHYTLKFPTRSNTIQNNIFDAPNSSAAVTATDGVSGEESAGCSNWAFPGVKGNTVTDNVLINPKAAFAYNPIGAARGTTTDTVVANNKVYATRAAAASALGWRNAEASLKTYLQSQGISVSSADGFVEYYERATQLRKGQWKPGYLGKDIANHVRSGFGMPVLP